MNICFFANNYSFTGGLERVLSLIASELAKTNVVHVVSMYNLPTNDTDIKYSSKVIINTIIEGEKKYIQQIVPVVKYLKTYLINNKIDVVIATSEFVGPYCYYATKNTKIKFICWSHSPALVYDESIIHKPIKEFSFNNASAIVTLTDDSRSIINRKYSNKQVFSIPNPLDPSIETKTKYNENSSKIISVGRYCSQKNYENMIEVAKKVLSANREWSWDLYGDGDRKIKEYLEKKIVDYNLKDRFNLKGSVSNMYSFYKDYSMLVMTSRRECFPMVLLEAMANKLPLIAYDVKTGPNILIIDDRTGYLIDAFDTDKMVKKIQYLIDNKNVRMRISESGKEIVDKYTIDNIIKLWESMLIEVTNEK